LLINDDSVSINVCGIEDEEFSANKQPLVIALSAHITEEDRKLGIEVGFDDFCKKTI
jgi:DNA-binding response OmpR family regulator